MPNKGLRRGSLCAMRNSGPRRAAGKLQAALLLSAFVALPGLGHAEAPLSAIDWLSSSVTTPAGSAIGKRVEPAPRTEAPVASGGALPKSVAVTKLDDEASPDAQGILSPAQSGLAHNLWGMGLEAEIIAAIIPGRTDLLPALQKLNQTLMLAKANPPVDSAAKGHLLIARIDRLLTMGALDQAKSLIALGPPSNSEIFRRAFDVALLMGEEDEACVQMQAIPNIAPTFPARIFCLARSGDWNAAALTLRTAQALGHVTEEEDALLSRFLDPDLYEGEALPPTPQRMTPLSWRMFEAIGEPKSTATLPLAFSYAELRDTAGWRSQIEAAERLVRAGAIAPERLLTLYLDRTPAASGGVWDRVEAVQRFERALHERNKTRVAELLPNVWAQMTAAELEVPFASLFAKPLQQLGLEGPAGEIAFTLGLLSPEYRQFAAAFKPRTPREAFLIGLAIGDIKGTTPPDSLGRAIAPAYLSEAPKGDFPALLDEGRRGEAILLAMERISRGLQGELMGVTDGLAALRALGFEDTFRATALELMLLERRG